VIRAQEADAVLHRFQNAAAKDQPLRFGFGAQQAKDEIILLETAITRDAHSARHVLQGAERFLLKIADIEIEFEQRRVFIFSSRFDGVPPLRVYTYRNKFGGQA
jgi:hypothetical protein